MASEVTVRKLTQGFMVSTPRTMRDGVPVEEAFAESTRPAMIQRVLRCLGVEPAEAYFEFSATPARPARDPEQDDDEGESLSGRVCVTGACGIDD